MLRTVEACTAYAARSTTLVGSCPSFVASEGSVYVLAPRGSPFGDSDCGEPGPPLRLWPPLLWGPTQAPTLTSCALLASTRCSRGDAVQEGM